MTALRPALAGRSLTLSPLWGMPISGRTSRWPPVHRSCWARGRASRCQKRQIVVFAGVSGLKG